MGLFDFFKGKKQVRSIKNLTCVQNGTKIPSWNISYNYREQEDKMLSSFFAGLELISNNIAMMPIKVREKNGQGKTDVFDHPLYNVLNSMPQSKFHFMKRIIQDVIINGNGYAYIKRSGDGKIKSLVYCPSQYVQPRWNLNKQELYYTCSLVSKTKIEPINMLHFIMYSEDGITGVSLLSYMCSALDLSKATEDAARRFFTSGCSINGILTYQGRLDEDQKKEVYDQWVNDNSGKYVDGKYIEGRNVAVLPGNMKYEPTGANANDSQLIETRQYNISEIGRYLGLSPIDMGDYSNSSYQSIEAEQDARVTRLLPWVTMIENELNRKILTPSEKEIYVIDLDEKYLLRTDRTTQANVLRTLSTSGFISINEGRAELGLPPIEGGDNHFINYTDLSANTVEEQDKNIITDEDEQ